LLMQDPTPDAKTKKQLKYWDGKLHRLRSGDYRVFYTFEYPYVSVLGLRRRDEDTYDDALEPEALGGLAAPEGEARPVAEAKPASTESWERWLQPEATGPAKTPLPRAIDRELLESLRVEEQWHAALMALRTEDDLLDAASIPEAVRMRVIDALYARPLEVVKEQPDLVLPDVDDLWRYKEGELLGFLLRLNPEQEKLVAWGAAASGPTLVKGGP